MKTLIITLLTFTSTLASAANIASYNFDTWAEGNREILSVVVSITDDQEMKILAHGETNIAELVLIEPQIVKLKESVYREIENLTFDLENAKIEKKYNQVVCMMYPVIGRTNHLYIASELVSGPTGCWVSNSVQPKNEYQLNKALQLKQMIKVLALTLMK